MKFDCFPTVEWMKKRWSYLREQYVRHLKQLNHLESDKPAKKNYKYFTEMSFLADHIQIRNGNYQDAIPNITNGDKIVSINSTNHIEEDGMDGEDKDKENDEENEAIDFVITETEIEAYNDDDEDNMFVELSDEYDEPDVHPTDEPILNTSPEVVLQATVTPLLQILTKPTKTAAVVFDDDPPELRTSEQHLSMNHAEHENCQKITNQTTESRCEDVIFGELVTSMLKKMDTPARKRAKKEILNILLS